jgi:hypothetical protein
MGRFPLALALLYLGVCQGCKAPPPAPFEVALRVESDPGHPLAGATVMKGGKEGPATGLDGRVVLKLGGMEGEAVDLIVKCPDQYVSPAKAISVTLHRISGPKLPEYEVSCPPTLRLTVVAVRADNGPNLPIMYLGKELTRTDATGAATVMFRLQPGSQFMLGLNTTEKGNERIQPQNPTAQFVVHPYDDVLLFDQPFTWKPRPAVYRAAPPKPIQIRPKQTGS